MAKIAKIAGLALGLSFMIGAAVPAAAVVTTFAQYSAVGNTPNIYWKNNGTSATNGTGGSIYTTSTGSSTVAGTSVVKFSYLQPALSPFVTNINADFTLLASVAATSAQTFAGQIFQTGLTGSFSFLTTNAITIGTTTYAAGSNLLSATFNNSTIGGGRNGTAGGFSGSTGSGSTITYTSDFLNFAPGSSYDFALSLTSITRGLNATPFANAPTRALRTFRANSTGSFSSDPAPTPNAVPEPAVWAQMLTGFTLLGFAARRRRRKVVAA